MKQTYLIFLLFISRLIFGQQYDSTYGKPLIFLVETNPWALISGTDIPDFIMYEKGQIIFRRIENKELKIYQVTLSNNELLNVIKSFSISDSIYQLPYYIEGTSNEDEPSTELVLFFDSLKTIVVNGDLRNTSGPRSNIPKIFLTVYDNLRAFNCDSAKEWIPNKIELVFWDFKNAKDSIAWLSGFPDLYSDSTQRLDDGMFSLYIKCTDFPIFNKYYSSLSETKAVLINGRKMAVQYRFVFPNFRWY